MSSAPIRPATDTAETWPDATAGDAVRAWPLGTLSPLRALDQREGHRLIGKQPQHSAWLDPLGEIWAMALDAEGKP